VKFLKLATDYLSCDIKINKEKTSESIEKYTPMISQLNFQCKTPSTPKMQVLCPTDDDGALSPAQQTDYRLMLVHSCNLVGILVLI
jgi:hypothetical protein